MPVIRMQRWTNIVILSALLAAASAVSAQVVPSTKAAPVVPQPPAAFDPDLAKRTGADERGMRPYVVVVLKTGPTRLPEGEARSAMFAGHFANINRLSEAGKLVLAGPFTKDPDGWRGLYVFAVADIEEARALTATDPVIVQGEMVAEYHLWYGSAASMLVPDLHKTLTPPPSSSTP